MHAVICVLLSACLCLISTSAAEREFAEPQDRHYPDGVHNAEFDHEAILGSLDHDDDFSKLSAHEAKKKLAELLKTIDSDKNNYISRNEISDWVLASFRKQDEREALEKLKDFDADADGQLSWEEYLKKVYGYSLDDLEAFKKDKSPEMQTFLRMVLDDQDKFTLADEDQNGVLNAVEHAAFLFPADYEYMHDHEISRTLLDVDKDKDGLISFDEYLGESKPGKEQLIVDQENFNTYDTDGNGKLDRNEIRSWTLPDRRVMADEEADHLIQESDTNHDRKLSIDEILDRHDLWVGSAATAYGQHLRHDPSEL